MRNENILRVQLTMIVVGLVTMSLAYTTALAAWITLGVGCALALGGGAWFFLTKPKKL